MCRYQFYDLIDLSGESVNALLRKIAPPHRGLRHDIGNPEGNLRLHLLSLLSLLRVPRLSGEVFATDWHAQYCAGTHTRFPFRLLSVSALRPKDSAHSGSVPSLR